MITEGQRQFIPREEGDQDFTQFELEGGADNKVLRFLKHAGLAAVIAAAMLNVESTQAQDLSSFEKQKTQEIRRQFSDEYHCELLVELTVQHRPELAPFFSGAMVREVDPNKAGKFGESEYYVYLPKYDAILIVPYNNDEHEPSSDSHEEQTTNMNKGIQEFTAGLLRGLVKNGLIDLQKDSTGTIRIIPHYRDGQIGVKTKY